MLEQARRIDSMTDKEFLTFCKSVGRAIGILFENGKPLQVNSIFGTFSRDDMKAFYAQLGAFDSSKPSVYAETFYPAQN